MNILYDIIVPEPPMSFDMSYDCVTVTFVTITCDVIL